MQASHDACLLALGKPPAGSPLAERIAGGRATDPTLAPPPPLPKTPSATAAVTPAPPSAANTEEERSTGGRPKRQSFFGDLFAAISGAAAEGDAPAAVAEGAAEVGATAGGGEKVGLSLDERRLSGPMLAELGMEVTPSKAAEGALTSQRATKIFSQVPRGSWSPQLEPRPSDTLMTFAHVFDDFRI